MTVSKRAKFKKFFSSKIFTLIPSNNPDFKNKKGCLNVLEVLSFFLIILLVLGFVTFCQKKNDFSKVPDLELVV
tara:strand:+ start:1513 stop:1734 length:222 start_codon:yes stop_codon:yes gene_type:complete